MAQYQEAKKRLNGRVLITNILPASPAFKTNCFTSPEDGQMLYKKNGLLSKVNGVLVNSVQDVRDAIAAGKDGEYLTIETDTGSKAALSINEIIEQEDDLAEQYGYQKSELIDVLAEGRKTA